MGLYDGNWRGVTPNFSGSNSAMRNALVASAAAGQIAKDLHTQINEDAKYQDQLKQRELQNSLAMKAESRAETEFGNKQKELKANELFNSTFGATKNVLAPDSLNQAVTEKQVNNMSYTPEEMKFLDGVDLNTSEGELTTQLADKGAKGKLLQDILAKTKKQMAISNMALNPSENTRATDVQRAQWAMNGIENKYGAGYVPDSVLAKYNTINAASAKAREMKQKELMAQMAQAQKEADSYDLKARENAQKLANSQIKMNSKGKSSRGGYFDKEIGTLPPSVIKDKIKEAVSPALARWANVGDSKTTDKIYNKAYEIAKDTNNRVSSDKLNYIMSNLVNEDWLGNNFKDNWESRMEEAASTYDYNFKKSGGSKAQLVDALTGTYNNKANSARLQAKKYSKELEALGKSPEEVQMANLRKQLNDALGTGKVNVTGSTKGTKNTSKIRSGTPKGAENPLVTALKTKVGDGAIEERNKTNVSVESPRKPVQKKVIRNALGEVVGYEDVVNDNNALAAYKNNEILADKLSKQFEEERQLKNPVRYKKAKLGEVYKDLNIDQRKKLLGSLRTDPLLPGQSLLDRLKSMLDSKKIDLTK